MYLSNIRSEVLILPGFCCVFHPIPFEHLQILWSESVITVSGSSLSLILSTLMFTIVNLHSLVSVGTAVTSASVEDVLAVGLAR
jgi:hypothetical protein